LGTPKLSQQQEAVGPRGSGDTLNNLYSAGERQKAPVSSQGRSNVLLWFLLVGVQVGLSTWVRVEAGAGHKGAPEHWQPPQMWTSGQGVVRGRQPPPTRAQGTAKTGGRDLGRRGTGKAGENGQSSISSGRGYCIRPSVPRGTHSSGDRYRLGHRPVTGSVAQCSVRP